MLQIIVSKKDDVTYAGLSLQPVNFEQITKCHTNSEFRT